MMNRLKHSIIILMALSFAAVGWGESEKAEHVLRLVLELTDGSQVIGVPDVKSVTLQTPYAKMEIPFGKIVTIEIDDEHSEALVRLHNGDKINGAVDLAAVNLKTIFGDVSVDIIRVTSITVWNGTFDRTGLVLYYTFNTNDNEGITDSSDSKNNGIRHGLKWIAAGKSGGAYQFDGKDDYIDCGTDSSLQITQGLTYLLWFRTSQANHDGALMGRRKPGPTANDIATNLIYRNTGRVDFGVCGTRFVRAKVAFFKPVDPLNDGRWHHVAAVYAPGEAVTLYLDGERVSTYTTAVFPTLNARKLPVSIGAAVSKNFFHGDIDEVMIYARPLTSSEVAQIYGMHR